MDLTENEESVVRELTTVVQTGEGRQRVIEFIRTHKNYLRAIGHIKEAEQSLKERTDFEPAAKAKMLDLVQIFKKDLEQMTPRDIVWVLWLIDNPRYSMIWNSKERA